MSIATAIKEFEADLESAKRAYSDPHENDSHYKYYSNKIDTLEEVIRVLKRHQEPSEERRSYLFFLRDGVEMEVMAESYSHACMLLVDELDWNNYD